MVINIVKKPNLKRLKELDWIYIAIWGFTIIVFVFLLTYNLSETTNKQFSLIEKMNLDFSSSLSNLIHHPLFLPYRLVEYIIIQLGGASHIFSLRLTSVVFALASIWLFLSICRRWFDKPTYILATALFGSSLWLLHFGRLAVPTITFVLAPLVIIKVVLWLKNLKKSQADKQFALIAVLAATIALTLYIPGIWLFWMALAIWQRQKLKLFIKKIGWKHTVLALGLMLFILIPLFWGLALEPSLIPSWFGFRESGYSTLGILELFGKQPMFFLGYGPDASDAFWLGRQPILDIFSAVMLIVGLGYYIFNFRLRQARLLILMLATSLVIFVLSGGAIGASAGLAYLLVAAGIGFLLQRWHQVFPKNPVAYYGAITLLAFATFTAVIYTTRSYFVAWHHSPATHESFSVEL